MIDSDIEAAYESGIADAGREITFRRVSGQAPRTAVFDATLTAIFRGYEPAAGIGTAPIVVSEGEHYFMVLAKHLKAEGFPLPLKKNDKILADGEVFNITNVDPGERAIAGAIVGKAVGV